jgi:hypothetical protein
MRHQKIVDTARFEPQPYESQAPMKIHIICSPHLQKHFFEIKTVIQLEKNENSI